MIKDATRIRPSQKLESERHSTSEITSPPPAGRLFSAKFSSPEPDGSFGCSRVTCSATLHEILFSAVHEFRIYSLNDLDNLTWFRFPRWHLGDFTTSRRQRVVSGSIHVLRVQLGMPPEVTKPAPERHFPGDTQVVNNSWTRVNMLSSSGRNGWPKYSSR